MVPERITSRKDVVLMFCPKCKTEFSEEFVHCPGCDVDLVPALPEEPVREKREFMRGLTRHIALLLKAGGIVVVVVAVLRTLLAAVPLPNESGFSFERFIPALSNLPGQLVLGLAYFGLGELILLLRQLTRGGGENGAS